MAYRADRTTPTQYDSASPSSELEQPEPYSSTLPQEMNGASSDNPLMSSLLPGAPPHTVQLVPPGPVVIHQKMSLLRHRLNAIMNICIEQRNVHLVYLADAFIQNNNYICQKEKQYVSIVRMYSASGKYSQRFTFSTFYYVTALFQIVLN